MNTQLESLEIESAIPGDYDFAVEDTVRWQLSLQGCQKFGEITVKRLLIAALNEDFIPVAKNNRSKSVPLRLEDPAISLRQITDSFGQHWEDRRIYGQMHNPCYIHARGIFAWTSTTAISWQDLEN